MNRQDGHSTVTYPRLDLADSNGLESEIRHGQTQPIKRKEYVRAEPYHAPRRCAPKMKKWEKRKAKAEYNEEERQWNQEVMEACLANGMTKEQYIKWAKEEKQRYKAYRLWERSQKKR